jgi:hypothetical protein
MSRSPPGCDRLRSSRAGATAEVESPRNFRLFPSLALRLPLPPPLAALSAALSPLPVVVVALVDGGEEVPFALAMITKPSEINRRGAKRLAPPGLGSYQHVPR